jgi:hypothetical protein
MAKKDLPNSRSMRDRSTKHDSTAVRPPTSQRALSWSEIAVGIVAERQPCRVHDLQGRIHGYGASAGEANAIIFGLIANGGLRKTFFGELVLPGYKGREARTSQIVVYTVAMLGLACWVAFLASGGLEGCAARRSTTTTLEPQSSVAATVRD